MKGKRWGSARFPSFEPLEPRLLLDAAPIITEFLADNSVPWHPADPSSDWDWIEIYNPTVSTVNLGGWHLTDDPDDLTQWTFPDYPLAPGAYLVVFASGLDRTDPAQELHTNFGLSKDGDYLALVRPRAWEADIVSEFDFADQLEDVSYGVVYDVQGQTELVAKGDAATYLVPTGDALGLSWIEDTFNDDLWTNGTTGLGYGLGVPDGTITLVPKQSVWRYLDNGSNQGTGWRLSGFNDSAWASGPAELGYGDGGERTVVSFGPDAGNRYITTYFRHTFTVEHAWQVSELTLNLLRDDGAIIYLNGQEIRRDNLPDGAVDYRTPGSPNVGGADEWTFFPLKIDPAGRLVDGTNVLAVEVHQSSGGSSDVSFDLEVIATTSTAGLLETDVEAAMRGVNASLYVRIPFTVNDPSEFSQLYLRTAYEDGYVAYLNGEPVAVANAPVSPQWNSAALMDRPMAEAVGFEGIDLSDHLGLLRAGDNILAIHAMNDAAADETFLIVPELVALSSISVQEQYFLTPTPLAENIPGVLGVVADTQFSHRRGFYDDPFAVTITTNTAGAEIRYTTDGSAPTPTTGTRYTAPIAIATTTTLRAMAFKPGYLPTNVDTQTYLFLNDVIHQSSAPAGFPATWNGEPADYEMDPEVVNNPLYGATIIDDLKAIPTMSLVMNMADFFGPGGIYANPGAEGVGWERAASIEMFYPEGYPAPDDGFQVDCGVRMYGGVGRNANFKKHALRLLFKGAYGPTKLVYPLFGEDAADGFDTLVLRHNFNDGYVWGGAGSQYIRDEYLRQLQLALGQPSGHGTFVHLYVNGLYWGLYNPVERPDQAFGATYFGGDKDNWDAINAGEATGESDLTEWGQMLNLCRQGMTTLEQYQRLQGNNPDGTDNPAYPDYLDVENYIVYMLVNFFTGNADWPGHNWYAARQEDPGSTGLKSFCWDSEFSVGLNSGLGQDMTGVNNSIAEPYTYLRQNTEFKVLFGDIAHRALFNGGPLYVDPAHTQYDPAHPEWNQPAALYADLADFIERAMVGESARWGDVASGTPYTLANWQAQRDSVQGSYMSQRSAIVLGQLRTAGFYPTVVAPTFNVNGTYQHGGDVPRGSLLTITAPAGTVYYTLDGTDPRLAGGTVSPTAVRYTGAVVLDDSYHVRARALSGGTWSALNEADYYFDTTASLRITEIMYNPAPATPEEDAAGFEENDDFEFIELANIGPLSIPIRDVEFTKGLRFTLPDITIDPGHFVVLVANRAAFELRYGVGAAVIAGEYEGSINNAGERLMLRSATGGLIHDFRFDDGWYPQTDGEGFSLTVVDPDQDPALWDVSAGWRASDAPGGTPGSDPEGLIPGAIVINEVLAHTDGAGGDWIELHNTTAHPIEITGWFLSDEAGDLDKWQITTPTTIPGGGYKVFTQAADFGAAFALSELGDDVYLSSNAGGVPGGYRERVDFGASPREQTFGVYPKTTGGTDFTLLVAATYEAANAAPAIGPLVINEIMYHPADPEPGSPYGDDDFEFIELYNRSGAPVDLTRYYLGDGVGFTFGWMDADSFGHELWTLQAGATAAWQADLAAGDYEVLVRWDLLDGQGNLRHLDAGAQYEIQHAGGPTVVVRNQNVNPSGWVSLGTFAFGPGPATVTLARGTDDPDRWTIADQVRFVGPETLVVDDDTPGAFATTGCTLTTIGPGEYVLVVRNEQAFATRYVTTGMTIAGEFSGNLANGGEKVKLLTATDPEPTGYVPYYLADYVHYNDTGLWPQEPDGMGFSLSRLDAAAYANDAGNWASGASGGTPGALNDYLDTTPPTVPANVAAQVVVVPTARINLTWQASADPQTWVDHYVVYRDGSPIGTSATPAWTDSAVVSAVPYSYRVSAVNRDGYSSALSAALVVAVPGITSVTAPDDTTVKVVFSEPLVPASAQQASNYHFDNATVSAAALGPDGVTVTLTTSELQSNVGYTLTVNNVTTLSGRPMPPNLQVSFVYSPHGAGYILREWWLGIGGNAISDLTSNPSYPNNPSGSAQPTIFESPSGFADNYGTRMRGYVHPPVTGDYVFWIATDDNGQLFLSTDRDPANKVLIASVPGWTSARQWNVFAEQQSVLIHLEAGRQYYIEALQKEGGGGDNLAVGWKMPGEAVFSGLPIDGLHLSPYVDEATARVDILATDPNAAEAGPNSGMFTVSRTGPTDQALTVYYTVGGTAKAADYTQTLSGQVIIPAGAASTTIPVTPVNDVNAEGDETVILTLASHPTYVIGAAGATVTIVDNDGAPPAATVRIEATDTAAAEDGADTGEFTVSRTGDTGEALTVYYTVGGTAGAADYGPALSGQVVLPVGAASVAIVVTPVDDAQNESNETIILTLTEDPAYLVDPTADAATVTIVDDDAPPTVGIAATDPAAAEEGRDPAVFRVTRVGSTDGPLTVYYGLGGTASAADYTPVLPGQVVIAAGASSATITITPVDDPTDEPAESLVLTLLADPAYVVDGGAPSAGVTIADNDEPPPPITVGIAAPDGAAAAAGPNTGRFAVTRVGQIGDALTVYYTVGGTASPADYQPVLSGQVQMPAGVDLVTITITPVDDGDVEPDETLILTLTGRPQYGIGTASATVTIADNDSPPASATVSVFAVDAAASEALADKGTFLFFRVGDMGADLTVYYTVGGTASADDYIPPLTGQVVIPATLTSVAVDVIPVDDPYTEPSETVVVTLLNGPGYARGMSLAVVTIADNDAVPPGTVVRVEAADAQAAEAGPDAGAFTVSRTGPTGAALTVYYTLGGTASSDDYTPAMPGQVVIPAGADSVSLTITPVDDAQDETDETLVLTLSANPAYAIGAIQAAITIADDDEGPPPAVNWLGETNDRWDDPANWSAAVVPGPETTACFNGGSTFSPALYEDTTVKGLDFGTAGWTLLCNGYVLTIGPGGIQFAGGAPTSCVDLGTGSLVVDYTGGASPFDDVAAWVASGYNAAGGGCWNGPGIASSAAAGETLTAVGVIDNQDTEPGIGGLAELAGVAVPAESVLVRYTWWGDANLDGKVDSNDYDRIDTNWLLYGNGQGTPPGGYRWAVGDFNHDGLIDSNDYDKIDTAWLLQGDPLAGPAGPTEAAPAAAAGGAGDPSALLGAGLTAGVLPSRWPATDPWQPQAEGPMILVAPVLAAPLIIVPGVLNLADAQSDPAVAVPAAASPAFMPAPPATAARAAATLDGDLVDVLALPALAVLGV